MIKVVTDTVPNLDRQHIQSLNIELVPVYVSFGTTTYLDSFELSSKDLFKQLVGVEELPTTSQPSVQDFKKLYSRIAHEHPGVTILSVHLTESLSGTIGSARMAAAQLPDLKIHIFDTRSVGLGHGLMVLQAARMALGGMGLDAVLQKLNHMRDTMSIYFVLDTLDYLAKGGRIGRAARFLGTLLELKPILRLENGTVDPYNREHTRDCAIEHLKQLVLTDTKGKAGVQLGVMHAACEAEGRALATELRGELNPVVEAFAEIGPAMGVYTGPGALGICWYISDEPAE